jgi:hypothetical protein
MPVVSSTNITDNSIVEKIRKLLALADSNKNSHEHERNVAMQAAMDLLAKHNLSMTQVNNSTLEIQPEEVKANFKLEPWIRHVLSAVCQLYYTDYYMTAKRDWSGRIERSPVFVGTSENIAVTIDMATWLINSVRRESNRLYKDPYERRSFRLGAAVRISQRTFEIRNAERKAATKSGTNIMVLRNQLERANEAHLATKNLQPFKSRPVYLDENAYTDGEAFGSQVGLNRHVRNDVKRLPQYS